MELSERYAKGTTSVGYKPECNAACSYSIAGLQLRQLCTRARVCSVHGYGFFFTIRYTEVYNYYTLMTIINPMWLSTYIQAELRGIIGIGMVTQ